MDSAPIPFSMESEQDEPKTGVFWDLEDFPIPDDLDPATVLQNIKLALQKSGHHGDVFVWAYLPGGKTFSKHSVKEYEDAGITTISTREDKHARLRRMILDFFLWSLDNEHHPPTGPNILVVTKDMVDRETTFLRVLRLLEIRCYHVLWALPDDNTTESPSWVKSSWHWRILLSGGDPINQTQSSPSVAKDIGHGPVKPSTKAMEMRKIRQITGRGRGRG
ncbi:unnamed protein product [Microthlaspi erraticum]|uniref:NYN domain-containing protein n=1 Tax=Microthlaspi erraticum TaxID=1685480 RepID=A0A6D2JJ72_9BRAS|nr:unnamed protein product [Microthlaspi erraticum]